MKERTQIDLSPKKRLSINKNDQKGSESLLKRAFELFTSKAFIKQGIKFAFVGAIGTFVNLSILYLLTDIFGILYLISETFAFVIALLNNYILNKVETFEEDIQEKVMGKGIKFAIICIIALLVNLTILFILVEYFGIFYLLAEIFAIFGAFLINFLGNRFWTFRHKQRLNPSNKINKRFVLFIMALWLLTLGTIDVIMGFIKIDIIFYLLGTPLIIVALFIMIKVIFIYFIKKK
ncbi:MAG: GtrA family protein [Candidatus Hodarchaeota archaeon]